MNTPENQDLPEPTLEELANLAEQEASSATTGPRADGIDALKMERDDLVDRLARVQADFANSRRRLEADAEQRLQYANSALIKSLLPVIDNFERALAVDSARIDAASVLRGLQVVHDQMMAVLKSQSVEIVSPKLGEAFDPSRHEAVSQQASDAYTEPTVLQCYQNGYTLRGRTLRPASVVVSQPA